MDAKEYLDQVRVKDAEIRNLRRDMKEIREMMYSFGGISDGERVQSSRNNDKFGTLYAKMDGVERQMEQRVNELVAFKIKVSGEINALGNCKYMTVLNCRYIHFMTWNQIADTAFSEPYTMKHILRIHGNALEKFSEVHQKMLADCT